VCVCVRDHIFIAKVHGSVSFISGLPWQPTYLANNSSTIYHSMTRCADYTTRQHRGEHTDYMVVKSSGKYEMKRKLLQLSLNVGLSGMLSRYCIVE
jgi:hypothetical protein